MGKILELSEKTYHQLSDLAKHQQLTLEEMLRLCLDAYEEAQYQRVHQQMIAEGVLVSLPSRLCSLGRWKKMTISSRRKFRGSRFPKSFWKTGANAYGLF